MSDVSRGDRLRISANEWNAARAAGEAFRRASLPLGPAARSVDLDGPPQTLVRVKNSTGGPVSRGGIVGLSDPLRAASDDEIRNDLVLTGVEPDVDYWHKFGIAPFALADGAIGEVVVSGVALCTINITDNAHEYARAETGRTDRLTSAESGSAYIVWRESGTGEKMSLVRLSNPVPEREFTLAECGAVTLSATSPGATYAVADIVFGSATNEGGTLWEIDAGDLKCRRAGYYLYTLTFELQVSSCASPWAQVYYATPYELWDTGEGYQIEYDAIDAPKSGYGGATVRTYHSHGVLLADVDDVMPALGVGFEAGGSPSGQINWARLELHFLRNA